MIFSNQKKDITKGFSLIELLVVISILTVVAAAAFVSLPNREDQARYDTTKERYSNIREAILGNENLVILNGTPFQKGFMNDMGTLPVHLDALASNPYFVENGSNLVEFKLPEWNKIGAEQDAQSSSASSSPNSFSNKVFPRIKINSGWRGPYVQKVDLDRLSLKDGWGNAFKYTINSSFTELFSKGKNGVEDPSNFTRASNDEIGYEEDFPFEEEAKKIYPREYEVAESPLPSGLNISINSSTVDTTVKKDDYVIGVIYPGIDLDELINNHESIQLAGDSGMITSLNDLVNIEDPEDSSRTLFTLRRTDGHQLFFNNPFARRYQICIFKKNIPSLGLTNGSLAATMVDVYPQVFDFLPGINPDPQITESKVWKPHETGRPSN